MRVAEIKISSFRGISIGAEHFYGMFIVMCQWLEDGARLTKLPEDYTEFNAELWRPIRTKKEAQQLNLKDGFDDSCGYTVGEMTHRFDTVEDVEYAGIKHFKEKMDPDNDILLSYREKEDVRSALCGPPDFIEKFNYPIGDTDFDRRQYQNSLLDQYLIVRK